MGRCGLEPFGWDIWMEPVSWDATSCDPAEHGILELTGSLLGLDRPSASEEASREPSGEQGAKGDTRGQADPEGSAKAGAVRQSMLLRRRGL